MTFKQGLPKGAEKRRPTYAEVQEKKQQERYEAGELTVMWHPSKGYRYIEVSDEAMAARRGYEVVDQGPIQEAMRGESLPVPKAKPKAKPKRRVSASKAPKAADPDPED